MSKKIIIILICALLGVLVGLGILYYLKTQKGAAVPERVEGSDSERGGGGFGGESGGDEKENENMEGETVLERKLPRLRHITREAVTGYGLLYNKKASSTQVRFMERAVGHIFETSSDREENTRLTQNLLPKINASFWNFNLNKIILQYLRDDNSLQYIFADLSVPTTSSASSTKIIIEKDSGTINMLNKSLPASTKDLIIKEDGKSIVYYTSSDDGSAIYTSDFDAKSTREIYRSPVLSWMVSSAGANKLILSTSPSAKYSSGGYLLDYKNNKFSSLVSGVRGFVLKSDSLGKTYLYSSGTEGGATLGFVDIKTLEPKILDIKTLADKCIFDKLGTKVYCSAPKYFTNGFYPDDWYSGEVSFNDSIYVIDVKSGIVEQIFDNEEYNESDMDIIDLKISEDNTHLYWIDKKDGSLWQFRLLE